MNGELGDGNDFLSCLDPVTDGVALNENDWEVGIGLIVDRDLTEVDCF